MIESVHGKACNATNKNKYRFVGTPRGGWTFRITITYLCDVYPLEPHFYIEKLGFAGVYLFFLFLLQNIDCGYSLEPPCLAEAVLTCTHNLCFE